LQGRGRPYRKGKEGERVRKKRKKKRDKLIIHWRLQPDCITRFESCYSQRKLGGKKKGDENGRKNDARFLGGLTGNERGKLFFNEEGERETGGGGEGMENQIREGGRRAQGLLVVYLKVFSQ